MKKFNLEEHQEWEHSRNELILEIKNKLLNLEITGIKIDIDFVNLEHEELFYEIKKIEELIILLKKFNNC